MEKLLHERLREHNKATIRYFTCGDEWQIELDMNEAQALAAEIERYYIPRPRFEDGEPVQGFDKDERVNYYYVYDDGSWVLRPVGEDGSDLDEINGKAGEPVNLPTPKVYDADGVEIKVGDTVYRTSDGSEYHVEKVYFSDDCGGCFVGHGECCGSVARYFTHERPVFDAEGVRICKGDTVWHKDSGNEFIVRRVEPFEVFEHVTKITSTWFKSGEFIHREPDSLEKLQQFAVDSAAYADGSEQDKFMEIADRLTALIERGA